MHPERKISNQLFVQSLGSLGKLMELHEIDIPKAKMYQSAAQNLRKVQDDIYYMEDSDLLQVRDVGRFVLIKIKELKEHNELAELKELNKKTPKGVHELLSLKGLGIKKIRTFWKELGILTLADLEKACRENRVMDLKGFGQKLQEEILHQLEFIRTGKSQHRYADIEDFITLWEDRLKAELDRVYLTGEAYRLDPIISSIEFIVPYNDLVKLGSIAIENFEERELNEHTLEFHNGVLHVLLYGYPSELMIWHRFNHSLTPAHRKHLKDSGWNEKPDAIKNDREIYAALNLPYIPPEMREGLNEWRWAKKYHAYDLVNAKTDFKGIVHMHTTWSDGYNSIRQMADACIKLGAEYMVLSDHSQTASYAGGLKIEKVLEQQALVDELNKEFTGLFKIFKGVESDILNDGKLDYPDDVLSTFDCVIAAIHAQMKMTESEATKRLIKAIENPYTTILGHPTGRMLLLRDGYPVNHKKVIDACAANKVVIELNANPKRLDMDWTWLWYAMERDVMISINPDAHNISELNFNKYGVNVARKGGLVRNYLLNALNLDAFEKFLVQRHGQRKSKLVPA